MKLDNFTRSRAVTVKKCRKKRNCCFFLSPLTLLQLPYVKMNKKIVVVNAIYAILCYEATDVGSRSIVDSYVPVKEISVNDI